MSIEKIIVKPSSHLERKKVIYPHLKNKVFHCTKAAENYDGIIKENYILNNKNGNFQTTTTVSHNSYATVNGYVSVFNLSALSDDQVFGKDSMGEEDSIRGVIECLNFFQYNYFFIFKDEIISDLIHWDMPKSSVMVGYTHIPYAKYYYNDCISLDLVEKILIVDESEIIEEKSCIDLKNYDSQSDNIAEWFKKFGNK